jgi:hypothetical protein
MASFMSSNCFETEPELLRRAFGVEVWESVCARTLVLINKLRARASRFIFSPETCG